MTEHDAFMQAIIENPADDTPRLVFADWLELHDEPERAEFIRVQCELYAMKDGYHGCFGEDCPHPIHALRRREWELLDGHKGKWALGAGIPATMDWVTQLVYCRGFVAEITLSCADWLEYRKRLLKGVPLEKVTLIYLPRLFDWGNRPGSSYTLRRGQPLILFSDYGQIMDLSFVSELIPLSSR